MSEAITRSVIERGDLAHLALFLWAAAASILALFLLRELAEANRRFMAFVDEIARLNRHLSRAADRARLESSWQDGPSRS
ncbi:hypothetical protein [Roseibium aestuarii]|uniref:Uncharacterized protein n=1 Tax=Roseibium aestuarii TaxID=2600299 RepID=A0ABW4JX52_9HYPH|nr:hypothetical protein [Roseibium aestuarii]